MATPRSPVPEQAPSTTASQSFVPVMACKTTIRFDCPFTGNSFKGGLLERMRSAGASNKISIDCNRPVAEGEDDCTIEDLIGEGRASLNFPSLLPLMLDIADVGHQQPPADPYMPSHDLAGTDELCVATSNRGFGAAYVVGLELPQSECRFWPTVNVN